MANPKCHRERGTELLDGGDLEEREPNLKSGNTVGIVIQQGRPTMEQFTREISCRKDDALHFIRTGTVG